MSGGESSRIVLNSRCGEDLASARTVERFHFVGRAGQSADLTGTPEAPKRSEGGGSPADGPFSIALGGLGIDKIYSNGLNPELLNIGEAGDRAGDVVIVTGARIARNASVGILMRSSDNLGGLIGGHIEEATPNLGGGEAASCKAGDTTRISGAASKSTPKVGIN